MAQIDDVINSLSSDELDTLNSDPKMLSDFKIKYSQPENPYLATAKSAIQTALPSSSFNEPIAPTSSNPVIGAGQAALQTLRDPTRIQATVAQPGQVAGTAVEKFGTENMQSPLIGKVGGFLTRTSLDPSTWTLMGTSLLPDEIKAGIPNLLEKAANIPKKATQLEGYNISTPKPEEIQQGIKNVQEMVQKIWKEHGDVLNKAKAEIGIPSNEDQIADSVRKYGNEFGLNLNKPLQMPENFIKNAPEMEAAPIKPLSKGDEVTLTHPTQPPVKAVYKAPSTFIDATPDQMDPIFDIKQPVKNPNANWSHPADSTLSQSTLESYGYKVPKDIPQMEAPKTMPMPYTIGDHDTPQQLMTEINRFKQNLPYIAKTDQAKAASYLQDQIVQQGVFKQDIAKGRTLGVLKSQYGDLGDVISNSSDNLSAAKAKMGDLYDTMKSVNKKLSGESGSAEAYLRRLFTSKSPAIKDDLNALTKLDTLAGSNTVETLFKQFAGEAYGQTLGQSVHTIFQAPYAALTSPKLAITPLMKYGPAVLKTAKFGTIGASSDMNRSALQSVRDRLNNQ